MASGERGLSSEAIAITTLGAYATGRTAAWPLDPSDLRRCLLLLEAVPEAREQGVGVLAKRSPQWAALADRWDILGRDAARRDRRDPPTERLRSQDVRVDEGSTGLGRSVARPSWSTDNRTTTAASPVGAAVYLVETGVAPALNETGQNKSPTGGNQRGKREVKDADKRVGQAGTGANHRLQGLRA